MLSCQARNDLLNLALLLLGGNKPNRNRVRCLLGRFTAKIPAAAVAMLRIAFRSKCMQVADFKRLDWAEKLVN